MPKTWRKKGEAARKVALGPVDIMTHSMPFDVRLRLAIQLEFEYREAYLVAVAGKSVIDIKHAWNDWISSYNNLAKLKEAIERMPTK